MTSLAEPTEGIAPVAPASSLLTVARPLPSGLRWAGGIAAEPGECDRAYSWAICNPGEEDPDDPGTSTKTLHVDHATDTFRPWPIYLPEGCDEFPNQTPEYYAGRAQDKLGAHTAAEISRELETGEFTSNPSLESSATLLDSGTAYVPEVAFSRLLAARAGAFQTGFQMFHVPLWALPLLAEKNLIIPTAGGRLQTPGGHAVSVGPGYDGGGKAGWPAVASADYIYVTGQVEWAASSITPDTITVRGDHLRTNTQRVFAERMAIYRFSPCAVFAIAMLTNGT